LVKVHKIALENSCLSALNKNEGFVCDSTYFWMGEEYQNT